EVNGGGGVSGRSSARRTTKGDTGLMRRSTALIIARMATAPDPKPVPRALIEKIGMLSRARQSEVEDFVDFIAMRDAASADAERELSRMVTAASSPVFATVWDNPEDDVYDAL
ncbi:hypothetical protein, partial [Blastomonas sp. CCH13-E1]